MSKFTDALNRNLQGMLVSPGAAYGRECCGLEEVGEDDIYEIQAREEGGFSWSACDSCGSRLGGQRYPAHGIIQKGAMEGEVVHLEICVDCLFFHANGDEPENWK